MRLRALRIAFGLGVAACVVLAVLLWAAAPSAKPGQLLLPAKTAFTKGPLFAYVQPWGGEQSAIFRPWSRFADRMVIDLKRFPASTNITWRWPPFLPVNDVGVWGYNAVMFGNYDGGVPEEAVAPVRVRDLKVLRETFSWSLGSRYGDANVLTEFYLNSTAGEDAVHTLEIGWFLHMPGSSRGYFNSQPLVGTYVDERGRRWTVRLGGQFCMIAPERAGDVPVGAIDLVRVLRWLRSKGRITGNEWFKGLAIGVEPVHGIGTFDLHQWQVTLK